VRDDHEENAGLGDLREALGDELTQAAREEMVRLRAEGGRPDPTNCPSEGTPTQAPQQARPPTVIRCTTSLGGPGC
jgi:hypothetical protein